MQPPVPPRQTIEKVFDIAIVSTVPPETVHPPGGTPGVELVTVLKSSEKRTVAAFAGTTAALATSSVAARLRITFLFI